MNVSVVIPCFNRKKTLSRSIDSVVNQTYKPSEIIIVDDGSTDGTRDFILNSYPNIKYFFQPKKGVSSARNKGIRESSSDLADTQVEKLKSLVNDLDFEDAEKYAEKVKVVKEAHFSNEPSGSDDMISEESEGESDELIESNSSMDKYVSTLRKTQSKN